MSLFTLVLVWYCVMPGEFLGGVLRCLLLFIQHFKSALRMWIQDIMEVFVSTTKSALWLRLNLNISMT